MTTGISLVRENAESMQPPRTLWVSFPLGRPLGIPGDAAFQHEVIGAALALLAEQNGPILADFPKDAPAAGESSAPACPVSFVPRPDESTGWVELLTADLASVMPWYELSKRRRGRTLVGVADLTPAENIRTIGQLLDAGELPLNSLPWFKHAVEDLKVLYLEALTAQPGHYDHQQIQSIFWRETAFAKALIQFYHLFKQADDSRIRLIARMIVPREAVDENTG